ncbi:MAG: hypothetical protein J4O05_02250, partial [Chloroflexi bacterium]|nr:hypothetical protein [Chloroflexota bacterium]
MLLFGRCPIEKRDPKNCGPPGQNDVADAGVWLPLPWKNLPFTCLKEVICRTRQKSAQPEEQR